MADNNPTLVLVHTVPMLVNTFALLGQEIMPGVQLRHVLDEPLLQRIRERGELSPQDAARLQSHIDLAQEIHAGAVLVTCSTVSPCVDVLPSKNSIPVIKIDEAMLAQAVAAGTRIGVIATVTTTLKPTEDALHAQAARDRKKIETTMVFVPDAFAALARGVRATHDRLVKQAILELANKVDVIVLAQASMANVPDTLALGECPAPVLTSPRTALLKAQDLLQWH